MNIFFCKTSYMITLIQCFFSLKYAVTHVNCYLVRKNVMQWYLLCKAL